MRILGKYFSVIVLISMFNITSKIDIKVITKEILAQN